MEAKHSFESERLRDQRRGGRGLCLRPDTSEKSNYNLHITTPTRTSITTLRRTNFIMTPLDLVEPNSGQRDLKGHKCACTYVHCRVVQLHVYMYRGYVKLRISNVRHSAKITTKRCGFRRNSNKTVTRNRASEKVVYCVYRRRSSMKGGRISYLRTTTYVDPHSPALATRRSRPTHAVTFQNSSKPDRSNPDFPKMFSPIETKPYVRITTRALGT